MTQLEACAKEACTEHVRVEVYNGLYVATHISGAMIHRDPRDCNARETVHACYQAAYERVAQELEQIKGEAE
jgi:hypothetical protein